MKTKNSIRFCSYSKDNCQNFYFFCDIQVTTYFLSINIIVEIVSFSANNIKVTTLLLLFLNPTKFIKKDSLNHNFNVLLISMNKNDDYSETT